MTKATVSDTEVSFHRLAGWRAISEGLWSLLRESMWFLLAIVNRTRQQRSASGLISGFLMPVSITQWGRIAENGQVRADR
jgi:hypothetical protein